MALCTGSFSWGLHCGTQCDMECFPLVTYCSALFAAGAVAEMTGRRGRVVADARGRGVYELRAKPDSTEMDSLNVSETGIWAFCGADTLHIAAMTLQGLGDAVAVCAMHVFYVCMSSRQYL